MPNTPAVRRPHVWVAVPVALLAAWLAYRVASPPAIALPAECAAPAFLAHRANGVASVSEAVREGFCGVEVDVHWREGVGLVVAHDELPADWRLAGSLTLGGLLDSVPELPALLWLDFKDLSRGNAAPAAAYLRGLIARHALAGRVIVEARQPSALWLLRRRTPEVIAAYWIPRPGRWLRGPVYDARLAAVGALFGFPALSLPHQRLTPAFARRFGRFALFTWTCNSPQEMRAAVSRGARIVLTDESYAATRAATAAGVPAAASGR